MSHFTVMVQVSAEMLAKHGGEIGKAVGEMLAPYQENNMGDCPKEYLVFNDVTDDEAKAYEKEPDDVRSKYPTLDAYVTGYGGYQKEAATGRYGYWENPNKKWDWWKIGGRWTGIFPLKPGISNEGKCGSPGLMTQLADAGRADIARIGEIDFDAVAAIERERAHAFFDEFEEFKKGKEFPFLDDPRSRAIDIGLLEVRQSGLRPGEETRSIPWSRLKTLSNADVRRSWFDVWKDIDRDTFMATYKQAFSPIKTYARLDASNGWVAPGKMGWFGCSSDEPVGYLEFAAAFSAWLKESAPDDTLVVVDCHI